MSGILPQMQVIARLRAIRLAKGMTVKALADKTGIDRAVIAKMENGLRETFNLDEAAALCEALGVDLRVVLSDEPMPIATKVYVV